MKKRILAIVPRSTDLFLDIMSWFRSLDPRQRKGAMFAVGCFIALLLTLIVTIFSPNSNEQNRKIIYGEEMTVRKGDVVRDIIVDGVISSQNYKAVYIPRIQSLWEFNVSWVAPEGARVAAGDVIIKLDDSALQKDLQMARSRLESARLKFEEEKIRAEDQRQTLEADIALSKLELEKQKLMVIDNDSVSQNEVKKQKIQVVAAQNNYERNKERLKSLRSEIERRLEMQKLELTRVQTEVDELTDGSANMEIKAAEAGLVVYPYFNSMGGLTKARQGVKVNVSALVAEIHDDSALIVKLRVPEVDAFGVVPGIPGELILAYLPDQRFTGKIASIAQIPSASAEKRSGQAKNPLENAKQFDVVFQAQGLPKQVVPGMSGVVKMALVAKQAVLRVPLDALIASIPQDDDSVLAGVTPFSDQTSAFIYAKKRGQNSYRYEKVEMGVTSFGFAEIKSGLNEGDRFKSILW